MAAKLAIISTIGFGTTETVAKVPGNILVPVGSVGALAGAMKQMTTISQQGIVRRVLQRIGQTEQGHARVRFRYSDQTHRTKRSDTPDPRDFTGIVLVAVTAR